MSPRTGRPKVDNPINIRTSVRLDKETDDKLNQYCIKNGIAKGEAIRKGVHIFLEDSTNRTFEKLYYQKEKNESGN